VEQKGSLVDENRLRFDFTHFSKMSADEIRKVEQLVNEKIRDDIEQYEERSVTPEKANEMGAIALFGEKYGEAVRVIRFGENFSTELCGGTHVISTGRIGLFRIVSEGAIAAGIRRIEAMTGNRAEDFMYGKEGLLNQVSDLLKNPKDILHGIQALQEENRNLKKSAKEFEKLKQTQLKDELTKQIREINGISFLGAKVELDMDAMKSLAFELRDMISNLFLVLATESNGKANLVVAISDSLVKNKKMDAGKIIRELAKEIKGGGGGQPHLATAGGKDPDGIRQVLEKAESLVPAF
jgi:alanyl-tRNA synthetase